MGTVIRASAAVLRAPRQPLPGAARSARNLQLEPVGEKLRVRDHVPAEEAYGSVLALNWYRDDEHLIATPPRGVLQAGCSARAEYGP